MTLPLVDDNQDNQMVTNLTTPSQRWRNAPNPWPTLCAHFRGRSRLALRTNAVFGQTACALTVCEMYRPETEERP
jgi:hypothetical protein